MLGFKQAGAVVFDNGNLIRTQAREGGVADAFDIQIFTEAYLAAAVRPRHRSVPLDCAVATTARTFPQNRRLSAASMFPDNHILTNWIALARQHVPFEGLPARIAWLGHGERTALATAVNEHGAQGRAVGARLPLPAIISMPGRMAHPNIMTESMRDGSDAIADWPLLNAMAMSFLAWLTSWPSTPAVAATAGYMTTRRRHRDRRRHRRGRRAYRAVADQ